MMINLTPHDITVRLPEGGSVTYPASGVIARVSVESFSGGALENGTPLTRVTYGDADLPDVHGEPIVSTMFADAYFRQHPDSNRVLYVPDSGPSAIRIEGRIVAVRSLIVRTGAP